MFYAVVVCESTARRTGVYFQHGIAQVLGVFLPYLFGADIIMGQ